MTMNLHEAIDKVSCEALDSANKFEVYVDDYLKWTLPYKELKLFPLRPFEYVHSVTRYPDDPMFRVNIYTETRTSTETKSKEKMSDLNRTPTEEWIPKQGDKVILKNGGPALLVFSSVGNDRICTCATFLYDQDGMYHTFLHRKIPTVCLQKA